MVKVRIKTNSTAQLFTVSVFNQLLMELIIKGGL